MQCLCVDPAQVHRIWPIVAKSIAEAMEEGGGGEFSEIEQSVLGGEKLLWLAADERAIWGSVVTGLHLQNGRKFCLAWVCAGKNREIWIRQMQSAIEKFAKDEGCQAARISGRRGWAREFPDYRLISITLEKVL